MNRGNKMKNSMKYILNTIVSLASFIGGGFFGVLLIGLMLSIEGPTLVMIPGPIWESLLPVLGFILIYGILIAIMYKKVGFKLVKLSICIFIAGILFGPAIAMMYYDIMGS